jgi:hypothetical protein
MIAMSETFDIESITASTSATSAAGAMGAHPIS